MQIKEEITINLSANELREMIKNNLIESGYLVTNINFKIEEKCEGFPEVYYKVFTGASCKVERI